MKRAIIYCRVSSPKQSIYGLSLDDQEFRLRKYCESRDWEVIEVIREVFSAKTFNLRKEISRIFHEMRGSHCRFEVILCTSFDRFSRDVSSAQSAMKYLMDFKVEFHTIDRQYNLYTVTGRREFVADAYRAMDDNLLRAAKAENGIKHRMRLGQTPFRVPFGYKKIPGNKHKDPLKRTESQVVFDELTAHIVKEAFTLVFSGNYSGEAACKFVNKKYRKKIPKQTFYNMLHNPYYMGKVAMKDDAGVEILVDGKHPALISESVWLTVQEKINSRKRNVLEYKTRNPDFPLKGFLICPNCKSRMTAGKSKSRTGQYHYYYNCQRKKKACTFNLKTYDAHNMFSEKLNSLAFPPEIKKAYREILKTVFDLDDAERNNRIVQIKTILNESLLDRMAFLDLLVQKKIMQKDFDMKIQDMENRNIGLNEELKRLEEVETSYSKYTKVNKLITDSFGNFYWSSGIDCQNQLLGTIIDGDIEINKQSIGHLKFNPNFMLLFKPNQENINDEAGGNIQPGQH